MSKIVRYQFLGSWFWFWLLCITGVGFPFAFLHLVNWTIRLETEVDNPEEFLKEYHSGKLNKK